MPQDQQQESKDQNAREAFLSAALPHIVFDGWTETAMTRAAADLQWPEMEVKRLFAHGHADLISVFYQRLDHELQATLADMNLEELKIRERIAACVRVRLAQYEPYREAVRRLVTVMALPNLKVRRQVRARLFTTADLMWRAAGDRSTDFNYYTKRGLLSAVYGATLLHWLDDDSEGYERTWAFLDRRIQDVMQIQKVKGRVSNVTDSLQAAVPAELFDFMPEHLPGFIPAPMRAPLEWVGRFARRRNAQQAQEAQDTGPHAAGVAPAS